MLRHEFNNTIIIEGKINGKITRGRPHKSICEEITHSIGFTSYQHLKITANDRHEWLQRQGLTFRS